MSIQGDGSKDNKIACFKPGKPLSSGLKVAKELVDPFTESDIENDPEHVIYSDRKEDGDVDLE